MCRQSQKAISLSHVRDATRGELSAKLPAVQAVFVPFVVLNDEMKAPTTWNGIPKCTDLARLAAIIARLVELDLGAFANHH
jgi:hypothetical protein